MKILINGAAPTKVRNVWPTPHIGHLFSPGAGNAARHVVEMGMSWAADNDCFHGFNAGNYCKMLGKLHGVPGGLFVTAPDVLRNPFDTLELFGLWEPVLHSLGYPVALVAQDGIETDDIPWDQFEALFIGGGDEFKLGPHAAYLVTLAKAHGKHVHVGRVNGIARMRHFYNLGADSIDGSQWGWFSDTYLVGAMHQLDAWARGEEADDSVKLRATKRGPRK